MKSVSRFAFLGWRMSGFRLRCLSSDSKSDETPKEHWRKTFVEQGEWSSKFRLFESENKGEGNFLRIIRTPIDLRPETIRRWWQRKKEESAIYDQQFIPERHMTLGNDLATAHFILHRGGKVKFRNEDKWYEGKEHDLPDRFTPNYHLEAVDASNVDLYYEGLRNFVDLKHLKSLILRNCIHINDWCLDYISGELQTLEYLDLYNCQSVTENGLACLYRLRGLKTLDVSDTLQSKTFQLTCLLLEESIPGLRVKGVKYIDV